MDSSSSTYHQKRGHMFLEHSVEYCQDTIMRNKCTEIVFQSPVKCPAFFPLGCPAECPVFWSVLGGL